VINVKKDGNRRSTNGVPEDLYFDTGNYNSALFAKSKICHFFKIHSYQFGNRVQKYILLLSGNDSCRLANQKNQWL